MRTRPYSMYIRTALSEYKERRVELLGSRPHFTSARKFRLRCCASSAVRRPAQTGNTSFDYRERKRKQASYDSSRVRSRVLLDMVRAFIDVARSGDSRRGLRPVGPRSMDASRFWLYVSVRWTSTIFAIEFIESTRRRREILYSPVLCT